MIVVELVTSLLHIEETIRPAFFRSIVSDDRLFVPKIVKSEHPSNATTYYKLCKEANPRPRGANRRSIPHCQVSAMLLRPTATRLVNHGLEDHQSNQPILAVKSGQGPYVKQGGSSSVPAAGWRRTAVRDARRYLPSLTLRGTSGDADDPLPSSFEGRYSHYNGMTGAPEVMRRLEHEPLSRVFHCLAERIHTIPGRASRREALRNHRQKSSHRQSNVKDFFITTAVLSPTAYIADHAHFSTGTNHSCQASIDDHTIPYSPELIPSSLLKSIPV